jgi:streptogramin lyase
MRFGIMKFMICFAIGVSGQFNATAFVGRTRGFAEGTGTAASFDHPYGLVSDSVGNVFVADLYNNRIRKVTPDGVVSTFATGLSLPYALVFDSIGNLFVTEFLNHRIGSLK